MAVYSVVGTLLLWWKRSLKLDAFKRGEDVEARGLRRAMLRCDARYQ